MAAFAVEWFPFWCSLGLAASTFLCALLSVARLLSPATFVLSLAGLTVAGALAAGRSGGRTPKYSLRAARGVAGRAAVRVVPALAIAAAWGALACVVLASLANPPQYDTYVYLGRALEVRDFQPYLPARAEYYFGSPFYSHLYSFFLLPFLLPGVETPAFVVTFVVPAVQFALLVGATVTLMVFTFDAPAWLPVLLLPTGYFLVTWLHYATASVLAVPWALVLLLTWGKPEYGSWALRSALGAFLFLLHSATFLLVGLTFVVGTSAWVAAEPARRARVVGAARSLGRVLRTPRRASEEKSTARPSTDEEPGESRGRRRVATKAVTGAAIASALAFFAWVLLPSTRKFLEFLSTNPLSQVTSRYEQPGLEVWLGKTTGLGSLLGGAALVYFALRPGDAFPAHSKRVAWSLVAGLATFVAIPAALPAWFALTKIPWMAFRYFVYLDLFALLTFSLALHGAFRKIKRQLVLAESRGARRQLKYGGIVLALSALVVFNSFVVLSRDRRVTFKRAAAGGANSCDQGVGFLDEYYYVDDLYRHVPDDYATLYHWLAENASDDDLVFVSPEPYAPVATWIYWTILYDKLLVDVDEARGWAQNGTRWSNKSAFVQQFVDYLMNGTKALRPTGRVPEGARTNQPVKYVVADGFSRRIWPFPWFSGSVVDELMAHPAFRVVASASCVDPFSCRRYEAYLFEVVP